MSASSPTHVPNEHARTGAAAEAHMRQRPVAELITAFDDPARDAWQQPERLLDALGPLAGATVIDIGAGSGYFAWRFVARGAHVIAADVDAEFQTHVAAEKAARGIPDDLLSLRRLSPNSPDLSSGEVDLAFVANTYHHIDERVAYFAKVREGIKPGGRMVVVDFAHDPAVPGPPMEHRLSTTSVVEELRAAGFTEVKTDSELLARQYVITASSSGNNADADADDSNTSAAGKRANFERPQFWDERYGADTAYVYGRRPNAFFAEVLDARPPGKLLTVAEGEGRNAVYAAEQGWRVTATDFSAVAREKALRLARQAGVAIDYQVADATTYHTDERFDLVTIVFLHLGPTDRRAALRRYAELLAPGGQLAVILYHPDQLGKPSGGPKNAAWLVSPEELGATFGDLLTTEVLERRSVILSEGPYHSGEAVVTVYVGRG